MKIHIDYKQATELLEMFGGEPGEITLEVGDGHSGHGLYAHYTELPEEGAEYLGVADDEAVPVPHADADAEEIQSGERVEWAKSLPVLPE